MLRLVLVKHKKHTDMTEKFIDKDVKNQVKQTNKQTKNILPTILMPYQSRFVRVCGVGVGLEGVVLINDLL